MNSNYDKIIENMIESNLYRINEKGEVETCKNISGPIVKTSTWRIAGFVHKDGYTRIKHDCISVLAHRFVFRYLKGYLNAHEEIDHINSLRSDNRIENLRLVSKEDNIRAATRKRDLDGNTCRNEKHHDCYICNEDIENVRNLYKTGKYTHRELSFMTGISAGYIGKIIKGKNRVVREA